ncbi:hypothetical protein BJP36_33840 [Moorena producens JHB]|uniref:Uncharacterized protein n=1 Tax=Moorena producens (strain JHB) TaxID=1454205 RepID=A0A1D9G9H5_MOOP1|nr:hypothetical protein [Moorena producens]AOY84174.1 hypothetical protein BJP36_33840 [Moorena producens JHB]
MVARTIGLGAGNRESGIGNRESGIGNRVIADYIANFVKVYYLNAAPVRDETSKPSRADRHK